MDANETGPPGNADGQRGALAARGQKNESTDAIVPPDSSKVNGNGEFGHVLISHFTPHCLRPALDNELVYRPVCADDPEIVAMADSMRKDGVLQPLIVTKDLVIISGHRRWTAAKVAMLATVPCIVEDINEDDPRFLQLLTEHNRQRVKSLQTHS